MKLYQNPVLREIVALMAVMVFCQFVLGTDITRNVAAYASVFWAVIASIRYLPHGIRAFARGGDRDNWRLLIGLVLLSTGYGASEIWRLLIRAENRPEWMLSSPLNWVLATVAAYGLFMCFTASTRPPAPMSVGRIYYTALGVAGGLLTGIFVARLFPSFLALPA